MSAAKKDFLGYPTVLVAPGKRTGTAVEMPAPATGYRPLHEKTTLAFSIGNQAMHNPNSLTPDFPIFKHRTIVVWIPLESNNIRSRQKLSESPGIRAIHATDVEHYIGLEQP